MPAIWPFRRQPSHLNRLGQHDRHADGDGGTHPGKQTGRRLGLRVSLASSTRSASSRQHSRRPQCPNQSGILPPRRHATPPPISANNTYVPTTRIGLPSSSSSWCLPLYNILLVSRCFLFARAASGILPPRKGRRLLPALPAAVWKVLHSTILPTHDVDRGVIRVFCHFVNAEARGDRMLVDMRGFGLVLATRNHGGTYLSFRRAGTCY